MATVKIRVQVNGNPLRRAFVEHATAIGFITSQMYITDDEGRVRDQQGNLGIDAGFGNTVDVRVHCQNSVVRVLNGTAANIAVHQEKSGLADGATIDLNTNAEQDDHYAILNRCLLAYDIVFRQFRPFSDEPSPDFPMGRVNGLRATRERSRRIELTYPSQFPLGALAFVEPHSLSTGYPLIHIRDRGTDHRLFGTNGERPSLLPSELAHALHFSRFTALQRAQIETDYVGWITSELANNRPGTHAVGVRTSPKVAFIEALDRFSGRFAEFVRVEVQGGGSTLLKQQPMTAEIRQAFLTKEASSGSVATLGAGGKLVPNPRLGGSDDEGSVYGCIFIDFARRTGLRTAVNAYLRSASTGAMTFGGFKSWVEDNRPEHLAALEAAQQTWGL